MTKELIINENVIFVQGYHCGAIYDLNTGKVYNVNNAGCKVIHDLYKGIILSNQFINGLIEYGLLNKNKQVYDYIPKQYMNISLDLAWLEVTEACNLKCVHCYEGECHKHKTKSLTIEQWKNIVDQLVEIKVKRIVIIGGEPSCYKNVDQLIEYCGKKDIPTTFFTNATMISDEIFNAIAENNIDVKVSIYGHNELVHDSVTQVKGSFDKMNRNIDRFIEKGVSVYPSVIIMKENEKYINDIKIFIENKGMVYKKYDVIRDVYGGTQNIHKPENDNIIKNSYYRKANFKTSLNDFLRNHYINTCWYGKIAIQENGNIIPCVFERNISYGNILDFKLLDILKNKIVTENWFLPLEKIIVCKDCEYRYCCKDCRALGISTKGNKYDKNPRCKYNPYKGEWEE